MTDAAPAVFVALEQSGFAAAIRQSPWLYPAANVGHIVSLTLFAGAVAVMDVRLLGGLAATAPARLLARARAFAVIALLGMAITGCVLFSAEASHLALNPAFQLKVMVAAAGLINVAIYELWGRRVVECLAPGAAMPARAKLLIIERLLPDRIDPDDALARENLLSDINMMVATGGGRERTEAEFRAMLVKAGLRLIGVMRTPGTVAIIEAEPA